MTGSGHSISRRSGNSRLWVGSSRSLSNTEHSRKHQPTTGVGYPFEPTAGAIDFDTLDRTTMVVRKFQTCPTKVRDSDTWVLSARTNLSHFGTRPLSLSPSLRPILIDPLPLMSAPVAIASTRSCPRNSASRNQVGSWKFVAIAKRSGRTQLRRLCFHLFAPGVWTLIPDLV